MTVRHRDTNGPRSGFSLIELMIVLVIGLTITAAIFQMINLTIQRSSSEQTKLDLFQQAREFMDQMSQDLHQVGYPSPRSVDAAVFTQNPLMNDLHAAAGLVNVDTGDLWLEGDVAGTGIVSAVRYHLDTSTTNNCPCLKRSQLPKINGDPLTGQSLPVYQVEVEGVQNITIFSAYNNGTAVGLPVTVSTASGTTIAGADTVQAILTLQAVTADPKTNKKPVTTLITTIRLNNCSQAAIGYQTSCQ